MSIRSWCLLSASSIWKIMKTILRSYKNLLFDNYTIVITHWSVCFSPLLCIQGTPIPSLNTDRIKLNGMFLPDFKKKCLHRHTLYNSLPTNHILKGMPWRCKMEHITLLTQQCYMWSFLTIPHYVSKPRFCTVTESFQKDKKIRINNALPLKLSLTFINECPDIPILEKLTGTE